MVKTEGTEPGVAAAGGGASTASSNQSGSNDFVKKLYQMLQEVAYRDVVTWTTNGDLFVVLNTNEFTKEILPRHFKHSNFASFVRQLNKYDFHKVKISNEEKQNYKYGEAAWEFKHPDFRKDDRELLENIKRKGPTTKKHPDLPSGAASATAGGSGSGGGLHAAAAGDAPLNGFSAPLDLHRLAEDVSALRQENKALFQQLGVMQVKYKTVVENIMGLRSFDERYYRSMGALVNCLVQAGIKVPPLDFPNPSLASLQHPPAAGGALLGEPAMPMRFEPPFANPGARGAPVGIAAPAAPARAALGHFDSGSASPGTVRPPAPAANGPAPGAAKEGQLTTTNLPNPEFHVLLVEDDNVCIQLCRKFLVKYGCQVTVATDGLNAILTVEHTRYDLVLMDIVMPNLDGATATSVIRSFDTKTPIIAMTGNIEESDPVTYLENGMSDILAKPFTKDDLYNMLRKHLLVHDRAEPAAEAPLAMGADLGAPNLAEGALLDKPSEKRPRLV
jgi:osomolarity two-component system response regulator SKN7